MEDQRESYTVQSIPKLRRFTMDAGWLGRRRHMVHGFLEVDVTRARQILREHKERTGERLSFTAFVLTCLARAVEAEKVVQAYRDWRGRLVIFDDINIGTMTEVEVEGRKIPIPRIIHGANRKSYREIHDDIRSTKARPQETQEMRFMNVFLVFPGFVRHILEWAIMRFPRVSRRISSTVQVTAVGMFAHGGGCALTMPNFSLNVAIGGIAKRPGVVDDRIEIREYLDLTLSFDHDIIDGAPATRFAAHFAELLESAYGLEGLQDEDPQSVSEHP